MYLDVFKAVKYWLTVVVNEQRLRWRLYIGALWTLIHPLEEKKKKKASSDNLLRSIAVPNVKVSTAVWRVCVCVCFSSITHKQSTFRLSQLRTDGGMSDGAGALRSHATIFGLHGHKSSDRIMVPTCRNEAQPVLKTAWHQINIIKLAKGLQIIFTHRSKIRLTWSSHFQFSFQSFQK